MAFRIEVCGAHSGFVDGVIMLIEGAVLERGLDSVVTVGHHLHGNRTAAVVLVAASDMDATAQLEACVGDALTVAQPVVPVVDDRQQWAGRLPDALGSMNAIAAFDKSAADDILEAAGVLVPMRGVFLSHRRSDGAAMALQLAQALRTKGIGTFVDVLDIAPAATVQGRILEALDELACLVLLESPDAIQSTWVAKEVVYAERQRLGTLSLCWAPAAAPGGAPTRFGQFDEGNRIDVSQNLVRTPFGEQLEDDYVAEVIAAIVREMTQALYYRRAQLERELLAVIPDAVRQGPWQFTVGEGSTTRLVGLAPYRPGAVDLHHLSKARVASQSASAFLVHHPIEPGTEAAEVLLWLGTGRDDFAVDTDGLAGIADGTS